jgi:hypothetical protein
VSRPYIVGLGGTTREGSSTEKTLSLALRAAASQGADIPCCSAGATSTCQPMSRGSIEYQGQSDHGGTGQG